MTAFADQELLRDFLTEAGEMLDALDLKLVELENRPDDRDLLNEIFRGFHTIKGGGGFLGATALVELCHRSENLLDRLRSGVLSLTPEMLDVILAATGEVKLMFGQMQGQQQPAIADASLLGRIDAALNAQSTGERPGAKSAESPSSSGDWWTVLLGALHGEAPAQAAQPATATQPAAAPAEAAAPPAKSNPRSPAAAPAGAPVRETTLRIEVGRFDQILNLSGEIGLTKNRLTCLRTEIVRKYRDDESLKVFDSVVNQLDSLVSDLQNAVMKARLQPVGRVFQKYVRQARDLARQLGKDVDLVLTGEETEIDKNMIEALNDPLVHLVRNAVDHGVERPDERSALGKPPRASVQLSARQDGDAIVIEIVDDGKGMRPEVLRQKAVEKGLLSAEDAAALDDRRALELIFAPGFSTKTEITDVSGRGVGMDVVRTNIQKLNGRIALDSAPGRGSRVTIRLPLTMAILPVLMVAAGTQPYAIPLAMVREIVKIAPDSVQLVSGRASVVVRGEVLPLLDLGALLGRAAVIGEGPVIGVIGQVDGQSMIIAVDRLLGQDEVVIKPLTGFKPRGVSGATVSSEGDLVIVLEMRELLG